MILQYEMIMRNLLEKYPLIDTFSFLLDTIQAKSSSSIYFDVSLFDCRRLL